MRVSDFQIYAPELPAALNRRLSVFSEAGWFALHSGRIEAESFRKLAIRLVQGHQFNVVHVGIAVQVAETHVSARLDEIGRKSPLQLRDIVQSAIALASSALESRTGVRQADLAGCLIDAISRGPPYDSIVPGTALSHRGVELALWFRWSEDIAEAYLRHGDERSLRVAISRPFKPLDALLRIEKPRIRDGFAIFRDPFGADIEIGPLTGYARARK